MAKQKRTNVESTTPTAIEGRVTASVHEISPRRGLPTINGTGGVAASMGVEGGVRTLQKEKAYINFEARLFETKGVVRIKYQSVETGRQERVPADDMRGFIFRLLSEGREDSPPYHWDDFCLISDFRGIIDQAFIEGRLYPLIADSLPVKKRDPKGGLPVYTVRGKEVVLGAGPLALDVAEFQEHLLRHAKDPSTAINLFSTFKNYVLPFFLSDHQTFGKGSHDYRNWDVKWRFLPLYLKEKKLSKHGAGARGISVFKRFYSFVQGKYPRMWPLPFASIGVSSPLAGSKVSFTVDEIHEANEDEKSRIASDLRADLDEGPVATTAAPDQILAEMRRLLLCQGKGFRGHVELKHLILVVATGLGYFGLLRPQEIIALTQELLLMSRPKEHWPDHILEIERDEARRIEEARNEGRTIDWLPLSTHHFFNVLTQINSKDNVTAPKSNSAGLCVLWNDEAVEIIVEAINSITIILRVLKTTCRQQDHILIRAIKAAGTTKNLKNSCEAILGLWHRHAIKIDEVPITAMKDLRRMGIRYLALSRPWKNPYLLKNLSRHTTLETTLRYMRSGDSDTMQTNRIKTSASDYILLSTDGSRSVITSDLRVKIGKNRNREPA